MHTHTRTHTREHIILVHVCVGMNNILPCIKCVYYNVSESQERVCIA